MAKETITNEPEAAPKAAKEATYLYADERTSKPQPEHYPPKDYQTFAFKGEGGEHFWDYKKDHNGHPLPKLAK